MESRKGKDEDDSVREKEKMLEKMLRRNWRERPVGRSIVGKGSMENQRSDEVSR